MNTPQTCLLCNGTRMSLRGDDTWCKHCRGSGYEPKKPTRKPGQYTRVLFAKKATPEQQTA